MCFVREAGEDAHCAVAAVAHADGRASHQIFMAAVDHELGQAGPE
jgi:hypothetical protein